MKLKLFIQRGCPFCSVALAFLKRASEELDFLPELDIIDEMRDPETAYQHDYYYVPTFYIDDEKVHEGSVDYNTVLGILKRIKEANS